ncbi:hypothetical protein H9Q10_03645 [Eikenella sp. S3360]|uniref:Uncharacterized protein n=1 Tax=Eikenella glucosivorans TaxID=2766967 RepID=A0ABS0N913_9NEIS|nr:hypothetical protein [Eikenella glucosivorans]MBH5328760.1 hypothetical protein [Eikenella glucosivorans]
MFSINKIESRKIYCKAAPTASFRCTATGISDYWYDIFQVVTQPAGKAT